jgi:hypothetical protein
MSHLPENFSVIRLELAREPGHPNGDPQHGYDLLAPLDDEGRIDGKAFRSSPGSCRVRRFRPGEEDAIGQLRHGPGGAWLIDYGAGQRPTERGFNFRDERFRRDEYVSIREDDDRMHTFRVASLRRP